MDLNSDFNFNDPLTQQFLFDETLVEFEQPLEIPDNYTFSNLMSDVRYGNKSIYQDIDYLVTRRFAVEQSLGEFNEKFCQVNHPCEPDPQIKQEQPTKRQGIVDVQERRTQSCKLSCKYVLFLKKDLSSAHSDELRMLFEQYEYDEYTTLEQWINLNASPAIKREMYEVGVFIIISKDGDVIKSAIQEAALFKKYCNDNESQVYPLQGGENMGLTNWIKENKLSLFPLGYVLYKQPDYNANIGEVEEKNDLNDKTNLDNLAKKFDDYNASTCPGMKSKEKKILSLLDWPEFKIEWKYKWIEIGCSKIRILFPYVRTRTASLNLYIQYVYSVNVAQSILPRIDDCALVAVFQGAVIGVALGNFPAALVVFKTSFTDCIKDYILSCLYPNLLILKHSTDWR